VGGRDGGRKDRVVLDIKNLSLDKIIGFESTEEPKP
jgi:hypothetical protein